MSDPFLISGPALISFSGGRTSAYMLFRILQAHGGVLPIDVHVAFANTGREREETLRFVHECSVRWAVQVQWLEFVTDLRSVGPGGRIDLVGYNSAARNGEPLDRLIKRKQSIFSTLRGRWCTQLCKVEVLFDYAATLGFGPGQYTEVIGFRADERDRVYELPRKPRNVDRRFAFPLADAGVRRSDVDSFWSHQAFDLELRRGTGNCDHCPFLSDKARIARARMNPSGLDWWEAHEVERQFAFGRMSIAEIRRAIASSPLLQLDGVEEDAADSECGAWCSGEAA
ncbi:Nin-like protein [Novosphingobium sp. FKTRR1]|uniref:Nin-like protein n=1 Tax=Novosphingobium sp. FKTRR1 TaxID=2879118 RepID=UPI001CF07A09|nr:Nin-like protein [Novosphingobium sp. FKTRR1]